MQRQKSEIRVLSFREKLLEKVFSLSILKCRRFLVDVILAHKIFLVVSFRQNLWGSIRKVLFWLFGKFALLSIFTSESFRWWSLNFWVGLVDSGKAGSYSFPQSFRRQLLSSPKDSNSSLLARGSIWWRTFNSLAVVFPGADSRVFAFST